MPLSYNAKVSLPTFDELLKPLAYVRETQDKADEKITALNSELNKYKAIVEQERVTNPNSILVENFDKYQNELNNLAENVMQYGHTRDFSRILNKSVSTYSGIAPMYEKSIKNREYALQKYASLKENPNNIINEIDDPTNKPYEYFYKNDIYTPTVLSGENIMKDFALIWDPIAKGISSISTSGGTGRYTKTTHTSGLSPEMMSAVQTAMNNNGDMTSIDNLKIPESQKQLLKNGVLTSIKTMDGYNFNNWSDNNKNRVLDYRNRGMAIASQQVNQSIGANPYFTPTNSGSKSLKSQVEEARMKEILDKNNVPKNPDGSYNLENITPEQYQKINYDIKNSNLGIFSNGTKENDPYSINNLTEYKVPANLTISSTDNSHRRFYNIRFPANVYEGVDNSGNKVISSNYKTILNNILTTNRIVPNKDLDFKDLMQQGRIIYVDRSGPKGENLRIVNESRPNTDKDRQYWSPTFAAFTEGSNSEYEGDSNWRYDLYSPVMLTDLARGVGDLDTKDISNNYIFFRRVIGDGINVQYKDDDLIGIYVGEEVRKSIFNKPN